MKNIFPSLASAKILLETGGGNSQTDSHETAGNLLSNTAMTRQRHGNDTATSAKNSVRTLWHYAACLLLAFVLGIGNAWGADPHDTYYKFTTTASKNASIASISGENYNLTMGSDNSATVTASSVSYLGSSYTHAANIGNSATKSFKFQIDASATNQAHIFLILTASSDRTIYLYKGSTKKDECFGRGSTTAPALIELVTNESGEHTFYASGSVAVYEIRVVYEKNSTWQGLLADEITFNSTKNFTSALSTCLYFRTQEVAFNSDNVLAFTNTVSTLRFAISFRAQKAGTITINYANPGSSKRTLKATTFTRPSTAGTVMLSQDVNSGTTTYSDKTFDVVANTEYVISFGSGATIKSVTFTAASSGGGDPEPEDTTPPTFVSSNPANDATGVAVSGTIVLTFSENIDDIDDTKFSLDGATIGTVAIDGTDATKVNVPYSGAANSATVTLSVAAGAVEDAAGNALAAALSNISFTTVAAAAPVVCPDEGTVFSMSSITTSKSYSGVKSDNMLDFDATYTGGSAKVGTTGTSGKTVTTTSDGEMSFSADGAVCLKLSLDCALAEGDVISFTSSVSREIKLCETMSGTYVTTVSKSYVIPHESDFIGEKVLWVKRNESSSLIQTLTISRPATITLDATTNGGTAVSPIVDIVGNKVVLPHAFQSGKKFKGWYDAATGGTKQADYYTISSSTTLYAQFEDLPTSGTLFSLALEDDLKPLANCTIKNSTGFVSEQDMIRYAIVSGGSAVVYNSTTNAHAIITTTPKLNFAGSSAYLLITLEQALQENDVITTTISDQDLSYSTTTTRNTSNKITKGTNQTLTITKDHVLEGATSIYLWAGSSSGGQLSSISITRPEPAPTYTLTLNPAGGSIASVPSGWTLTDGKYIKTGIEDGSSVDLLALTQSGYLLDGWKDGENTPYTSPVTITGNLTLTAQWASAHTVSFVANGGGSSMSSVVVKDGTTYTIPACGFTPEDAYHAFHNWAIAGVEGKTTGSPNETFTMPAGNVTLTAQWTVSYAITEGTHTNGSITIDPTSASAGTKITLSATPNTDYMFDAWDVYKTGESSTKVAVTNNQFTMPAYAVTVNATFVADQRANILYVTSNSESDTKASDKLYDALKNDYNIKLVGPTSTETVTSYALIVLHESVTGSNYNATAVAAAKNSAVPVLNTKSYFYNSGRWGWGTPNAGKKTKGVHVNTGYCNITSHPLFNDLTPDENDSIIILSSINSDNKPIQPIGTFTTGKEGYTLANVPDGCAIHELTPAQRGVASGKYILISVYNYDLNNLNANGQKLFQNAAAYLIDGSANWTPVATLSSASISGTAAYSVGDNIELTASATGVSATTTYTWYKGATLEAAIEAGAVQASETAANDGNVYAKASCALGDAGTYWCVISNGTDCDVNASLAITVSDLAYDITFVSAQGTAPTATTGISYTLPELSATGYQHMGWTANINVTVDAEEVTAGTTIANGKLAVFGANVTFTAVWVQKFDVTFNLNGHGESITKQTILDGGKVTKPADPSETDWNFGGWYKEAGCTNAWDFANDVVTEATVLYAKWTADPCGSTERKSLSKVVLTAADDGTVSGYNGDEYAGDAVIGGLNGTQTAEVDDSHEGNETGYKVAGNGTGIVFATLKKGTFQEGDKVVVTITKKQDAYKVEEVGQPILDIYYGTSTSDATFLTTIENVTAAGTYAYRLTAADVTAIGSKKGIGVFRPSSGRTQNPYVYSVEITGCRNWTVMRTVSFDMGGHGSAIADLPVEDGEKISAPAEPEAAGYLFQGWYKENTFNNLWDFANDIVEDDITLYAKWATDPCSNRQSLSKVVLTSKTEGAVSGYNSKEYAGDAVIGGLNETQTAEVDPSHEGNETGYKLAGSSTGIVFATLAKGTFQEGDKVVVTITKQQDAYKVEEVGQPILDIYYGTSKDDATFLTTIENVTAAGSYTYRLTAADVTAIGSKNGIGVFRPSSGRTQNPYVYSVEITGCRDWSVSHNVTFNMHDHGSAIAAQSVYEGGKVTKPAVVEPEGWAFDGWYKESTYENLWDFDLDVMGTSDIELHAKWESEAGVIKLFDGEGNLNTTNFISAAKTTIEINEVEYPTLADFGSNRTSLAQAKQADMVMYSATTDATKIKFELYNANGSAKSAYLWMIEEGDDAATAIDVVEVPGNKRLTTSYYTFNGTKNRSFYLTSGSKADIKVMQVKVMDNGTAIPQFGKAGYSVNFNKGRIAVASNGTVSFEGASIHSNDEYSVLNNESLKPKTYIQFNNAVANMTVKIKKASSNAYYVTNDLDNKGTSYTTDQEIVMSTTGTWYIGSVSSGSVAALSKIEFIAPKCEAPTFEALANSDICSSSAYVALDGTGTVSDGGSITYKWYAEGDAETVLATTATYMPEADGSYYVVALHHVDGYTDNEVTSDVVTVTTHEGTAITEGLAHVRKTAGEAATLTVEATGKDLHYAWKECETIDGTYTDVAGAADSKSLEIIVPDGIKYYKVIVSSGCGADQESIAKVEKFVPVSQVVVSTSVSWDLTTCADAQIQLTKTSSPKKGEECLMANIEGVHMNENFHSESLVMSGEYIYRTSVTGNPTCAEYMKFETSVPGLVRVHFAGNGDNRCLRITSSDGVQYSSVSTGTGNDLTEQFEVAAGEIELMGMNDGHTDDKKYMRFFQIEFYALDKVRNDSWIAPRELGTVCYPNGHIVVGADMYKMAGVDGNGKFAFDQVEVTEPGVPYLFEATGYDPIKFYKTTAAAADEAGTSNGMVGTFEAKTLTPAEGENMYYFQGTHFYSVAERTKNLSVPAYRCYVDLNEPHPAAAPMAGVRRVTFGVEGASVPTGMDEIGQQPTANSQKLFINGRLFIIRGEKLYDATGRLVK